MCRYSFDFFALIFFYALKVRPTLIFFRPSPLILDISMYLYKNNFKTEVLEKKNCVHRAQASFGVFHMAKAEQNLQIRGFCISALD
jgi:hypothetical protein